MRATSPTCGRSSGSSPPKKPEKVALTPFSRTAVGVLAAVFAFILLGRGLGDSYTVFLLPLERDFGWTRSQVASVYSIYLLVHGGTATLAGLVFDRLGPRWVYGTGTALLGAAFWAASSVTGLWQFYLCIGVLVGLGASLNGMVPGSALRSEERRVGKEGSTRGAWEE